MHARRKNLGIAIGVFTSVLVLLGFVAAFRKRDQISIASSSTDLVIDDVRLTSGRVHRVAYPSRIYVLANQVAKLAHRRPFDAGVIGTTNAVDGVYAWIWWRQIKSSRGAGRVPFSVWLDGRPLGDGVPIFAYDSKIPGGVLGVRLSPSPLLYSGDFTELPTLAYRLRNPPDPVSTLLRDSLREDTRNALEQWLAPSPPPTELEDLVLRDLNALISTRRLWLESAFAGVALRPSTRALIDNGANGPEFVRLNRNLLEDAYPAELRRISVPTSVKDLRGWKIKLMSSLGTSEISFDSAAAENRTTNLLVRFVGFTNGTAGSKALFHFTNGTVRPVHFDVTSSEFRTARGWETAAKTRGNRLLGSLQPKMEMTWPCEVHSTGAVWRLRISCVEHAGGFSGLRDQGEELFEMAKTGNSTRVFRGRTYELLTSE
ncbi:MAG: hypothetical protein IT581_14450 [Verrucomicrobiales bacterium]|nr:hypothetical protein [Verrucomicrobiales bacterium]